MLCSISFARDCISCFRESDEKCFSSDDHNICNECVEKDLCKVCENCNKYYRFNNFSVKKEWCKKCIEKYFLIELGCNKKKMMLCKKKECRTCYFRSFVSCDKSCFWGENDKNPRELKKFSHSKYWFFCIQCEHKIYVALSKAVKWQCCYCSNKRLCEDKNCDFCFKNSFASHEKAKYWSSRNNKQPRELFLNSGKNYWFNCIDCHHEIYIILSDINRGQWCGYCSSNIRCKDDRCEYCFKNSFASIKNSKYWSEKNGNIKPRDCARKSHSRYWFDCQFCNHTFDLELHHVTEGIWCGYCAHLRLCKNDDCNFCFQNSFASHEKSKYWNYEKNKGIRPRDVFRNTQDKYYFDAECGDEVYISLANLSNGRWCGVCKNKTEKKIYEFLKLSNIIFEREVSFEWCKNKKCLPFDFVINNNIIIELDGKQHFEDMDYWKSSSEEIVNNDVFKMKKALEHNFTIIRLVQIEVWRDSYDWKSKLLSLISKTYTSPEVIYVSQNETIYDTHKSKMSN